MITVNGQEQRDNQTNPTGKKRFGGNSGSPKASGSKPKKSMFLLPRKDDQTQAGNRKIHTKNVFIKPSDVKSKQMVDENQLKRKMDDSRPRVKVKKTKSFTKQALQRNEDDNNNSFVADNLKVRNYFI